VRCPPPRAQVHRGGHQPQSSAPPPESSTSKHPKPGRREACRTRASLRIARGVSGGKQQRAAAVPARHHLRRGPALHCHQREALLADPARPCHPLLPPSPHQLRPPRSQLCHGQPIPGSRASFTPDDTLIVAFLSLGPALGNGIGRGARMACSLVWRVVTSNMADRCIGCRLRDDTDDGLCCTAVYSTGLARQLLVLWRTIGLTQFREQSASYP